MTIRDKTSAKPYHKIRTTPIGRFRGKPERNVEEKHRINGRIQADAVRVVDQDGEQVGVMKLSDALRTAQDAGKDLVEISPNASPPVCKITDYGKLKFQEQKKAAEAKKNQSKTTIKELPMRPRTDVNDYEIKLKKAREFLLEGHKVKFNLRFRGREVTHKEIGQEMLDRITTDLDNMSRVEFRSDLEGRFMSLIVAPDKKKIEAVLKQQQAETPPDAAE